MRESNNNIKRARLQSISLKYFNFIRTVVTSVVEPHRVSSSLSLLDSAISKGIQNPKELPHPSSLSTTTLPPCINIISLARTRPNPEPRPDESVSRIGELNK